MVIVKRITGKRVLLLLTFCLLLQNTSALAMARYSPPPHIISLSPKNHSTFLTGDSITISVKASSSSTLIYRYFIDNQLVKDWTRTPAYSLKALPKSRGKHTIKGVIQDRRGKTDSKSVEIFIFVSSPKPAG